MSNSLTDSVARLQRAGSEHSQQTKKLRIAADNLLTWLKNNIPAGFNLPCHCEIYPSGEFLRRSPGGVDANFKMTISQEHSVDSLMKFSYLIEEGFLDQLSQALEVDAHRFKDAAEKTESFLAKVPV
ncbi:MAG TPA: hypothetical protein VL335_00685 [Candidatus Paceibacterota bacterium]|jgi:hypothetical protein|nr:hypothetical protein [Candidatus Paceibacterota bacterium]